MGKNKWEKEGVERVKLLEVEAMVGSQDHKQVGTRHNPPDNCEDRSQGNIGLDGNN